MHIPRFVADQASDVASTASDKWLEEFSTFSYKIMLYDSWIKLL